MENFREHHKINSKQFTPKKNSKNMLAFLSTKKGKTIMIIGVIYILICIIYSTLVFTINLIKLF